MAEAGQRRPLTDAQRAALAKGRRFQPGQSGNPKGGAKSLRELRELLEAAMQRRDKGEKGTRLERLVSNLSRKLALADDKSLDLILRRVWPAPVQVELSGELSIGDTERDSLDARVASGLAAVPARANGHDPASDLARGSEPRREGGDA